VWITYFILPWYLLIPSGYFVIDYDDGNRSISFFDITEWRRMDDFWSTWIYCNVTMLFLLLCEDYLWFVNLLQSYYYYYLSIIYDSLLLLLLQCN
jgi:hypothetical protein